MIEPNTLCATHQPGEEVCIENGYEHLGAKMSGCPSPDLIAVCGDPVVGRALVLLLQSAGHEAKFSSVLGSGRVVPPEALADIRLVLVTPLAGFSTGQREALLASLEEAKAKAGVLVLELAFASEETEDNSGRVVSWPCSIEKLSRRIEKALLVGQRACAYPHQNSPDEGEGAPDGA
jgi:hypothetical protein